MGGKFVSTLVVTLCGAMLGYATIGESQAVAVGLKPETAKHALVSLSVVDAPLAGVLQSIARQSGLHVFGDPELMKARPRVTLRLRGVSPDEAFVKALAGTGLRAEIAASVVTIVRDEAASASVAQGGIAGKVVDGKTRQGLRRATISLIGTNKEATSGDDGSFRIADVSPGSYTVQVRMLGYVKATTPVTVTDGQTVSIEIALTQSVNALDQVIVTGTVVSTEMRAVPNAMTVITAKEIEQRGITRIDQLFRGDVPGLFALNNGTQSALDQVIVFSRGATNLPTGTAAAPITTPLKTYIDGIEMADPSYLSQLDPKSIERIEVLTGPQASTVYGSNAMNGVMQVFTKRGTTARPQLTASFLSGLIQNDLRPALSPQHDYSAQVGGTEGRWSYNAGGTWNHLGAWSPGKQTTRTSGFGGARMQVGPMTADGSLRLNMTRNREVARVDDAWRNGVETGLKSWNYYNDGETTTIRTLNGNTLGLTLGFAPFPWWSHELVVGTDVNAIQGQAKRPMYRMPSDSTMTFSQSRTERSSLRYSTTARIPFSPSVSAVVTVGGDQWRSLASSLSASSVVMTGTLTGTPSVSRNPSHNAGGFFQGQLGIVDALYVTYGLRAEWNPNYGDDAQPNLAPRYGVAYTRDLETPLGPMTAKMRASYGKSTRPPTAGQKMSITASPSGFATAISIFGPFDRQLASPDLGPEFQQGGEGGLELYFGNRASLVITRYNQTVDGLITNPAVDSLRSLLPNSELACGTQPGGVREDGYCYRTQTRYVNVGSTRNQGWELGGNVSAGRLTVRGTYSWTKSRFLGMTPAFRAQYNGSSYPQYQPGSVFQYLPEHTWSASLRYAHAATTASLDLNGVGFLYRGGDEVWRSSGDYGWLRLLNSASRMNLGYSAYRPIGPGYTIAHLNAAHRFTSMIEGVLQIQNLTNFYQNDYEVSFGTIGRQTKAGFRLRM